MKKEHKPNPAVLDEVASFAYDCVYLTREQETAAVLAAASSHDVRAASAQPRIIVTGESESGKSTLMDFGLMLSKDAWMSDATNAAVRSFFNTDEPGTLFFDEASKTFGESGLRGHHLDIYKVLANGYRRRSTLSFSVSRTKHDVSNYGVAWCAGIGECVPIDIMKRGIRIRMVPKPEELEKLDTLDESVYSTGLALQESLHEWVLSNHDFLVEFNRKNTARLHSKLTSRRRQIWGPGAAIAYAAGGDWPQRWKEAFLKLGLDDGSKIVLTPNQQILLDTAEIIEQNPDAGGSIRTVLFTRDLIDNLPPRELYDEWTEEFLVQQLTKALGPSTPLRGENFDGRKGQAKGRRTYQIMKDAEQLKEQIKPEEEDTEEFEDEFAFTEDVTGLRLPALPG